MNVRPAEPRDVDAIRSVILAAYGHDYILPEMYDHEWLTRAACDDELVFLVAEKNGEIVGTASALLGTGDHDDLLSYLGRLVVAPAAQGQGVALALAEARIERVARLSHVAVSEVRASSRASQAVSKKLGLVPVGFEPLKFTSARRESLVVHSRLFDSAPRLRRNNPRVIPEAARLANLVMPWLGLPADAITIDEPQGFSTDATGLSFEPLTDELLPSALRLANLTGRSRELFGRSSLASGSFLLERPPVQHVVARRGDTIVGSIGFTHVHRDRRVHVTDLVATDDTVAGALLANVDRLATIDLAAAYVEFDVSAYAPALQRTLAALGYVPVVYLPAMVFEDVERLDIVRMARLTIPYDLDPMDLTERSALVKAVVDQGFERSAGVALALEATQNLALFEGLSEDERREIARLARVRTLRAGEPILSEGEMADRLLVLAEGEGEVRTKTGRRAAVHTGSTFGEIALLERSPRIADVFALTDCTTIEIDANALERVLTACPRLGTTLMRNLARGLSAKLREDSP